VIKSIKQSSTMNTPLTDLPQVVMAIHSTNTDTQRLAIEGMYAPNSRLTHPFYRLDGRQEILDIANLAACTNFSITTTVNHTAYNNQTEDAFVEYTLTFRPMWMPLLKLSMRVVSVFKLASKNGTSGKIITCEEVHPDLASLVASLPLVGNIYSARMRRLSGIATSITVRSLRGLVNSITQSYCAVRNKMQSKVQQQVQQVQSQLPPNSLAAAEPEQPVASVVVMRVHRHQADVPDHHSHHHVHQINQF